MNEQATSSDGDVQKAPHIPSGDELYREIMEGINPELLLSEAERESKFAGESQEQHKERVTRYASDIEEYKKQYAERQVAQSSDIRSFGNNLLHDFEAQDDKKEESELDSLESQIANL